MKKTMNTKILENRFQWRAQLFLVSYGVHIGIRVNAPKILECFSDYLPPGYELSSSSVVDELYSLIVDDFFQECHYQLYRAEEKLIETSKLEEALDTFDSDLRLQIAIAAREKLFVHAGVVGWQGKAIVIPGRSFSGKTTLVAALVEAGATYYSDEYAVLDAGGLVHPYTRLLSLRQEKSIFTRRCSVEELGGKSGTEPLPVGMVIHTQYQPGVQWNPRKISPGEAVLSLLDNTVVARLSPDLALPILVRAASGAIALEGKRGEAKETAVALLKKLLI